MPPGGENETALSQQVFQHPFQPHPVAHHQRGQRLEQRSETGR
jgi:hypothetical protein